MLLSSEATFVFVCFADFVALLYLMLAKCHYKILITLTVYFVRKQISEGRLSWGEEALFKTIRCLYARLPDGETPAINTASLMTYTLVIGDVFNEASDVHNDDMQLSQGHQHHWLITLKWYVQHDMPEITRTAYLITVSYTHLTLPTNREV